jgi:hypothetical protein
LPARRSYNPLAIKFAAPGAFGQSGGDTVNHSDTMSRLSRCSFLAAGAALPRHLGDWQSTIDFTLGPYGCGKDLKGVSAMDLARAAERDGDAFCTQGYGALLANVSGTDLHVVTIGGNFGRDLSAQGEGVWESGMRAAEAALRKIGALKEPGEDKPARRSRERPRRRWGEDD